MVPVTPVKYLSPREVGDIVGISGDTIRRLIKSNQLKAVRMPPGNHYRIAAAEVLRYVGEYRIPLVESNRKLLEELSLELEPSGIATEA
jgi:excisionase family DNA binding protein